MYGWHMIVPWANASSCTTLTDTICPGARQLYDSFLTCSMYPSASVALHERWMTSNTHICKHNSVCTRRPVASNVWLVRPKYTQYYVCIRVFQQIKSRNMFDPHGCPCSFHLFITPGQKLELSDNHRGSRKISYFPRVHTFFTFSSVCPSPSKEDPLC